MANATNAFKVLATNHTSFTVSDLDSAIAFFRDAMGFEVTSKAPRDPTAIAHITGVDDAAVLIAYIRGPGHSLELIEYTSPADREKLQCKPCDTGFAHIAFDVDNIDGAIAASAAHGFKPINSPYIIDQGPNAGGRVVYLRNEDGIAIEFIERTS